jgi:hypothetical protein
MVRLALLWSGIPDYTTLLKKKLLDFSISPGGYGVHWKRVDEDLSVHGILNS